MYEWVQKVAKRGSSVQIRKAAEDLETGCKLSLQVWLVKGDQAAKVMGWDEIRSKRTPGSTRATFI